MKFREFIAENKEKHAVMAFGRMNPPTTGHEVLVNKVKSVANRVGGSHHVVLSHSQDAAKNPLTAAQKVKHAKRFFPDTNISLATKDEPNFLTQAAKLHKQGVTHLHMVAGADRVAEYHKLLHKYNGTHEGALFNFKKITLHNAGARDPDAEGTEGMSASKMRSHATSNSFDDFRQGIPKHVPEHHAKELFRDVRKGMQIKEESEPRIPKKEGQPDKSDKHSDLYTDEDPKGTIHGLKFATTEDAEESVRKIKSSGRPHAHKIQAAIAMEQRAKVMGKASAAAVYRSFINSMKEKTKDVNEEFEMLSEGVHDQGIFKAVFLAGGPGSGKDYVMNNTLEGQGLVEINSDKALEFLMDKEDLNKMMPADETEKRNLVRGRAKNITELRQQLALLGRNGLIINGTGDDIVKTKKIKDQLEKLGYETSMLLVNTRDDISAQRNIERGQRGGRAVPEPIRKEKWDNVQLARTEYAQMFGANYSEFDNSEDLREADPETIKARKTELLSLFNKFKEFVATPPQSQEAQFWTANELDKKDTLKVSKDGAEQLPPSNDAAANEAHRMGLQYYGFGRYGRDGKVTHRSVHGQLIMVNKEVASQPKIPISSSSQKPTEKVVNESVTISITGDTAEEVNHMFAMMHGGTTSENKQTEQYQFTDNTEVLTLGSRYKSIGDKPDSVTITNDDILIEKHEILRDKNGKVRVFMLRNTAAKEAHTKNGIIVKYNKGYIVKLNGENKNARLSEKTIHTKTTGTSGSLLTENRRSTTSQVGTSGTARTIAEHRASGNYTRTSASTTSNTGTETCTEETTRSKITLSEIRTRQKEKMIESIDKGIEPGLSMAASGENLGRAGLTKTKLLKKPLEELTGDETTMSIGDQKELELKRKGIDLATFKARKFVG